MSDELRAAAENIVADYEYAEKQAFTMWKGRTLADALKLARAYLAEHPASDGEAVTCQRLMDAGFNGSCRNGNRVFVNSQLEISEITRNGGKTPIKWQAKFFGARVPCQRTMGDIRRLCAALGIELKESK